MSAAGAPEAPPPADAAPPAADLPASDVPAPDPPSVTDPASSPKPRGFGLGLGLTVVAYVIGFFGGLQMANGLLLVGALVAIILFVGFSMPQLGGSPSRYFLGVGAGLGIAFLVFALCALLVISMLGG